MRVGLIGYGAWGRCHARALAGLEDVTLAGILCNRADSAIAAAADFPAVPVLRERAQFLALPLDVVDIAAPNHTHADYAVAALAAGRHVLVEKPLATSVADCDRIIRAAAEAGRLVSVNHELRVSSQWGMIRDDIVSGALGTPMAASCNLFRRPFRAGAEGWRHDAARVGSWILEEPVHFFDLLLWYFAEHGDPVSVRANASDGAGGLRANLSATVEYASGAFFTVGQLLAGFEHHCALEIAGSAGALRAWWSGDDARTTAPRAGLAVLRRGAEAPVQHAFAQSGEIFELTEHLRRSIAAFRAGRSPLDALEARRAVLVCLAVEQACQTGEAVPLVF
jgi:myo-inositol 2-dehydrogenase/D-chiro-inositol 1-dehydrogenase